MATRFGFFFKTSAAKTTGLLIPITLDNGSKNPDSIYRFVVMQMLLSINT